MKFGFIFGIFALVVTTAANATDVCSLASLPMPASVKISPTTLNQYKTNLATECKMSDQYQELRLKAQRAGVSLERINLFQALRYVKRYHYEKAKASDTPVPVIYQVWKADYAKSNTERGTVTWDNFSIGIQQLESERARLVAGGKFQYEDLLRVHTGFYSYCGKLKDGCEDGDFAHVPQVGKIKPPSPADEPWWKLKAEEVAKTTAEVEAVNSVFLAYGLATSQILNVRALADGTAAIYGGDTRENLNHIQTLLKFVNDMLIQARAGQHMILNGIPMTPGEVAMMAQQMLVDLHPFYEGNGRVSRFIQELVLTSFSLPPGASGDLMDSDVLTRQDQYYTQAMSATQSLMSTVLTCFEGSNPIRSGLTDQSSLPYDCRLIQ